MSEPSLDEFIETLRLGMADQPNGLAILDPNGVLRWANRAWLDRAPADTRLGLDYLGGLRRRAETDECAVRALAGLEALRTGRETAFRFECATIMPGAAPRRYVETAHVLPSPMSGIMLTRVDIPSQEGSEKDSPDHAHRYQALVEFASDMISRLTLEGAYLYASPACQKMLGYAPEELVGLNAYELIHPDDWSTVREIHEKALQGLDRGLVAYRMRRKSGDYLWVETQCGVSRDEEGVAREVIAISRDVSGRIHAEEVLRESEQRYRLLFERAHDAIMLVDIETGILLDANPAAERMLGRKREDVVGKHHTEQMPPETREFHEQSFRVNARIDGKIPVPVEFLHADGHLVPVEIYHSPVRVGDRLVGYGFFRDLTETLRSEKALRDSEARYRTLMENAGDAILISDMEGVLRDGNRAAETLLGYGRGELLGRHASLIHPAEEAANLAAAFRDLNTQGHSHYVHKVRRQDGGVLPPAGGKPARGGLARRAGFQRLLLRQPSCHGLAGADAGGPVPGPPRLAGHGASGRSGDVAPLPGRAGSGAARRGGIPGPCPG